MTREEALHRVKGYLTDIIPAEDYQEVEEIVKALEPESCSDAVSREAVDELSKSLVHTTRDKADFLCNFWEGLRKLPPVTPQPKLEQSKQSPINEGLPEKEDPEIEDMEMEG